MEYTLDAVISFTLFASTLAISLMLVTNLTILTLNELTPPVSLWSELVFPTSLEVVSVEGDYIIKSLKRCLVTYVIIEPEGRYYVGHGITPLKVVAKPGSWIIAFTYTSVSIKRGVPIHGQMIVSMYGVTTKEPISPYVIINGSNYEVVPRISDSLKGIPAKDLTYSVYNNTVVLKVRG